MKGKGIHFTSSLKYYSLQYFRSTKAWIHVFLPLLKPTQLGVRNDFFGDQCIKSSLPLWQHKEIKKEVENLLMSLTRFRTAISEEGIARINEWHSFPQKFPLCFAGMRFGLMQTKVGIVSLLSKYQFNLSMKTPVPLVFDRKSIVLSPVGGMWLQIKKRVM
jgi:hypothetical protein